jgi:uncharacterized protein (DUF169 family)
MESKIAMAIKLKYEPVAIVLTNTRPEGARQFKEGKWGCIMFLIAAAAKGETAVMDKKTFGCQGGGIGMGFGNQYVNFAGGEECFCYFLSVGNEKWEQGHQVAEKVKPFLRRESFDNFLHGERYVKSPDLVRVFIRNLPITEIPYQYIVLKPLKDLVSDDEKPEVIVFLGDMDQISALTILANYGRGDNENVIFPYAAGCQSMGIYPFREARSERPRAVLGLNDISARVAIKQLLTEDLMSFAMPLSLFREMEENVSGSFLERPTWKRLLHLKSDR